jgi:hypothetical protein
MASAPSTLTTKDWFYMNITEPLVAANKCYSFLNYLSPNLLYNEHALA